MKTKFDRFVELVQYYHRNQKRKYTGEPYVVHLNEVLINERTYLPENIRKEWYLDEVSYGHDLIEDTEMTAELLVSELIGLGYPKDSAEIIRDGIIHCTDVYTSDSFPNWNRNKRKTNECIRISKLKFPILGVKLCDSLSNLPSIKQYDEDFFKTYRNEFLMKMKFVDIRYGTLPLPYYLDNLVKLNYQIIT